MLAMFDAKTYLRSRGSVRPELVRHHNARRCDGRFQEPPHEPLRSATVSSTLDQDVKNEAVLIDGPPKPVWLSGDRDDDFIQMPFVAPRRSSLAELIGEGFTELLPPPAHRLIGHANSARRKHLLDHAKAKRKSEIEPHRIAYHLSWKAMTAIEGITSSWHGPRLAAHPLQFR